MHSKIKIPIDDQYITGDFFLPEESPKLGILFIHGWISSNRKYIELCKRLLAKNVLTLAINLRGHGDSPFSIKQFSRQDHLNDILVSYKYLKKQAHSNKIVLFGKSYGGYLSAIASALIPIDYLILSQSALYPNQGFKLSNLKLIETYPDIFRSKIETINNNRALKAISNFNKPILFIESEKDEEIPEEVTNLYKNIIFNKKGSTFKTLKNADHALTKPEYLNEFYETIENWISCFI